MKTSHKVWIAVIFLSVSVLCSVTNVSYSSIAETAITIMSITLAAYIAVAGTLLGSPYSYKLKSTPCPYDSTRSNLGSLTEYLRCAGRCSIFTLFFSCVNLCFKGYFSTVPFILKRLIIGAAFGIFSINLFFFALVFQILIVSMMNAAVDM